MFIKQAHIEALEGRIKAIRISTEKEFTLEDVRAFISAVFPARTKQVNQTYSTYRIKHVFEDLSILLGEKKYCANDTVAFGFLAEKFKVDYNNCGNMLNNTSKKDLIIAEELIRQVRNGRQAPEKLPYLLPKININVYA